MSFCAGHAPTAQTMFNKANAGKYMQCFNDGYDIMQCHKNATGPTPNWPDMPFNEQSDTFPTDFTPEVQTYCAVSGGDMTGFLKGSNVGNNLAGFNNVLGKK